MNAFRRVLGVAGISGISLLLALLLYASLYFSGRMLLAFLTLFVIVPLAAVVLFRLLHFLQQHALWSVRNRLLFVYGLMGVLPILLLFVLAGLAVWGFTNELAIYLATSALERRLDPLSGTAEGLIRMPVFERRPAATQIREAFDKAFPGIAVYVSDETGEYCDPADSVPLRVNRQWRNADGLVYWRNHFYGWAHRHSGQTQVTVLAPLSTELIENLVPNLGVIVLMEKGSGGESEVELAHRFRLPPAMNALDYPVFLPSNLQHYHIESPNQLQESGAVLFVLSRPSAVLATFFSRAEFGGGMLSAVFTVVIILFVLVEAVAVVIGISLARRLTGAVNQVYEGTRRVLLGDFGHRIPVRDKDQLGDLSQSFNQMTTHLERLFTVEKEKDRLQAELQFAREVQNQLFPKVAPQARSLKLTAVCDPARMVSGDYFDYQDIERGKLAFAIGDVAGKGISAALLMATIQAALRSQISLKQPGVDMQSAEVVSKLNKQIYEHTSPEKYATFFFATFDEATQNLTYTNAGHLPPLLFRDSEVEKLNPNGTVVGAFPGAKYEQGSILLKPGDLLVCYTDGITEPENPYGEMFGEERLIDLVKKHLQKEDKEIVQIVLDAVRSWTGSPELQDDMTLMLAREVQTA